MKRYKVYAHDNNTAETRAIEINANSKSVAIQRANDRLVCLQNIPYFLFNNIYEEKTAMLKLAFSGFEITPDSSVEEIPPYQDAQINDIISASTNSEGLHMPFNVNWNDYTAQLVDLAAPEMWSNNTYPNNGILTNYLVHTYTKLIRENNVIKTNEYALFNTGLFTKFYEPIYAYEKFGSPVEFKTGYELGELRIHERPERANYFTKPELLLFDWHYPINVQYRHILDDVRNVSRLPEEIINSNNIVTILNGAIDTMRKRVSSNYKLAIPQYFNNKIQLLLPLCLCSDQQPDVALVITKVDDYYQGHTCISLDMAYNNARLIAKPENSWLS